MQISLNRTDTIRALTMYLQTIMSPELNVQVSGFQFNNARSDESNMITATVESTGGITFGVSASDTEDAECAEATPEPEVTNTGVVEEVPVEETETTTEKPPVALDDPETGDVTLGDEDIASETPSLDFDTEETPKDNKPASAATTVSFK